MTKYLAGIHLDNGDKVLKVVTDVDQLSCEMLAVPGVLTLDCHTVSSMVELASMVARGYNCRYVEVDCPRGKGSYRLLKI